MKKVLLMMAVFVALSFAGCDNSGEYKAKGEAFAKQLEELMEKQDTAGILAMDQEIQALETEIIEAGDSASLTKFQEALKDVRVRTAPFLTTLKIEQGTDPEEALKHLANEALRGGVGIGAITSSIDSVLQKEQEAKKAKKAKK
ncbi:MAG: hypothetical protein IJK93_01140 [Muribaculaceae bacterium]|nr:hypothetical protein [Muribaculaceae bacterium]